MEGVKIHSTAFITTGCRKEKHIWAKGMKTLNRRDCDPCKILNAKLICKGMKTLNRRDCDLENYYYTFFV